MASASARAIARALAVQPELVVCDEPTSVLTFGAGADSKPVVVADDPGLAYPSVITHNFAVVEYLAHEWR